MIISGVVMPRHSPLRTNSHGQMMKNGKNESRPFKISNTLQICWQTFYGNVAE